MVLRRYPATVQPCSEPEPLGNAGGLSGAGLWRFRSALGQLVLRAWPPHGQAQPALEQIHQWLHAAGRTGLVPVPIAGLDDRTLQEHDGRCWELAPWLEGSALLQRPPSPSRLRAGFAGLAAVHASLRHLACRGYSPGLIRRAAELEALIEREFRNLEGALNSHGSESHVPLARRWLELARTLAPDIASRVHRANGCEVALQPCLRDVRPEHLLFARDRLTGLIDFGAMGIDTVSGDLARLLSEWLDPDRDARAAALTAYANVRPLDEAETRLIDVFSASTALLAGAHWVRWHFLEGRTFEDPSAVRFGLQRSVERLAHLAVHSERE